MFFEIEGTNSTRSHDIQEVLNYSQAMSHGMGKLDKLPVSNRLLRDIHLLVMHGARGGDQSPGDSSKTPKLDRWFLKQPSFSFT